MLGWAAWEMLNWAVGHAVTRQDFAMAAVVTVASVAYLSVAKVLGINELSAVSGLLPRRR